MSDGTDAENEPAEPYAEYGEVDERYREPDESSLSPDIPEAPDLTDRDVDPVIEGTFWTLVVVFNVGLVAVSIGLMFVIFQGELALGGQITLAGVLVLGYGFYRYRSAKQVISERVDSDGDDSNGDDGEDSDGDSGVDNRNE